MAPPRTPSLAFASGCTAVGLPPGKARLRPRIPDDRPLRAQPKSPRDDEVVILGIETSCDETAAALVTEDGRVLASVVSSQAELHARFGGVVPEVASRRHLELVAPIVRAALDSSGASLDKVDRVAVTQGPGLVGALLVGVSAAKAIAWARRLPLAPVDHLDGHLASLYLEPDAARAAVHVPARERRAHDAARGARARTLRPARDDARRRSGRGVRQRRAAARPWLSGGSGHRRARQRRGRRRLRVPRRDVPGLDFSFSGLKTALLYAVRDLGPAEAERRKADLAASYQRAIVNALVRRLRAAAEQTGLARIAVVGGVAANSELRAALPDAAFAPLALCTDNAAMIASAARFVEPLPYPRYLDLDAYASVT